MNETIINGIDVSECPCKDDDKCLEVPILNEYGDLIDYQDCELQTLCPYRLKTKIQRLQEENKRLQMLSCANCGEKYLSPDGAELYEKNVQLQKENEGLKKENEELKTYIQKMDKPEIKTIDSEIALKNIELQKENEKIKKQYNCYACGNCNETEDYINLEKHHKGLRKQFDELVKRNNTLSLRIEELENEKEKSKEYVKDLQVRKDRYYLQVLEFERQISDWITFYMKISDIVSGNYEILDSQGLQDLRQIISEVAK
ncbi:MAG: hypothetical protein II669_02990 [Elusimicrobia bacterium]|nr:hypothetical protein [Elusimicrobiota bacterium]